MTRTRRQTYPHSQTKESRILSTSKKRTSAPGIVDSSSKLNDDVATTSGNISGEEYLKRDEIQNIITDIQSKISKKSLDQKKFVSKEVNKTITLVKNNIQENITKLDHEIELKIDEHADYVQKLRCYNDNIHKESRDLYNQVSESLKIKIAEIENNNRAIESSYQDLTKQLDKIRKKRKTEVSRGLEIFNKDIAILKENLKSQISECCERYKNIK